MSMSFVSHGGLGKTFENPSAHDWNEARLRSELQRNNIWVASLPSNVECWYHQLLPHVEAGHFTFDDFVEEFGAKTPFDFGATLRRLLKQPPVTGGGWLPDDLS